MTLAEVKHLIQKQLRNYPNTWLSIDWNYDKISNLRLCVSVKDKECRFPMTFFQLIVKMVKILMCIWRVAKVVTILPELISVIKDEINNAKQKEL